MTRNNISKPFLMAMYLVCSSTSVSIICCVCISNEQFSIIQSIGHDSWDRLQIYYDSDQDKALTE